MHKKHCSQGSITNDHDHDLSPGTMLHHLLHIHNPINHTSLGKMKDSDCDFHSNNESYHECHLELQRGWKQYFDKSH